MRIFYIFSLLLFFCLSSIAGKKIDVLFCLYDTGDSNLIAQVIPNLKKSKLSYVVAVFGRAETIFKEGEHVYLIKGGSTEDRAKLFSADELERLKKEFDPKVVLVGMASAGQAQVLNAFPKAKRVAVYDNFDPPMGKEFIQPFIKTVGPVDLYMVPARFLVGDFQKLFNGARVEVVGQPALEEWADVFEKTDRAKLRKDLKIDTDQKVILFAGGMDATYKDSLNLFVRTVAQHPEWKVFITYHPKTDGSLERESVAAVGAQNITVSNDVKTNVLATIADVLVCHKSSVCQQAFSVGVPCLYVAGKDYTNFLIEQRLVPRVETAVALEQFLVQQMAEEKKSWQERMKKNQGIMAEVGIPSDASMVIGNHLEALIAQS